MRVLIVGRAGREHARARALASEAGVEVICAPGNAGMADVARCVPIVETDGDRLATLCRRVGMDLAVIGPAEPLAAGIADRLRAAGTPVVGPSRAGARLEMSKRYTRLLARRLGIPGPRFELASGVDEAIDRVSVRNGPVVLKLDGLQGGKGTFVAPGVDAALAWLHGLRGTPAASGHGIVLEEFLAGEELSFTAAVDGEHVVPLARVRDAKRRDDGDCGPNTGGMGSWSGPGLGDEVSDEAIVDGVIRPVLARLSRRGAPYRGFLYAGLMVSDGEPRLLEFNTRLGDSEAQTMLARLRSPLSGLLLAIARGELDRQEPPAWSTDFAVSVTLARHGYPTVSRAPPTALALPARQDADPVVSFASVQAGSNGLQALGGRILHITARASTLPAAAQSARDYVGRIRCNGSFHRRDIGAPLMPT